MLRTSLAGRLALHGSILRGFAFRQPARPRRRASDDRSIRLASHSRLAFLAFVVGITAWTAPVMAVERIVTIGDSWAFLIANGSPGTVPPVSGYGNAMQTMLNTYHPGVTVANEAFGGGTAAQHATMLADITARINAHPTADIVWLSSGGNDMLLGQLAGGYYNTMSPEQKGALYSAIGANVNTVVNHILSIRPDLQVVIEGYDYINVWDTVTGQAGDTVRFNLGIGKSGVPLVDLAQNQTLNQAFRDMEQQKVALADASRRVHHIWNYGLNSSVAGYSGYFGTVPGQGFYPPDLWPDLPVRASLMGASDPIHLNTQGYVNLSVRAEQAYFGTALQAASLTTNRTTLDFGNVLVGASGSQSVAANNAGPNFTKVKDLTFPAASGEFSGASQAFQPLFQDPTLGSDTAVKSYGYAPTNRGTDTLALTVSSDSGSRSLTLSGRGVAPVNHVTTASAPLTRIGASSTASVQVQNIGDGNTSGLGEISNLHGTLSGPSGNAAFAGAGAAVSLADGASQTVNYAFSPTSHGPASSSVTAAFTNGNSAGTNAAESITVTLQGTGVGPVYQASAAMVGFGQRSLGSTSSLPFSLANVTTDANAGNAALTDLTILSATFSGSDASLFSLGSFVSGAVLHQGTVNNFTIGFNAAGALGAKSALLTFVTDQGAALGTSGQSFTVQLSGQVVAPSGPLLSVTSLGSQQVLNFDSQGHASLLAGADAGIFSPLGAVHRAAGDLIVADTLTNRLLKVDAAGQVSTLAGLADGVVSPTGLALAPGDVIRTANYLAGTITSHNAAGQGTVLADATDGVNQPFDVAVDSLGNTFVANLGSRQILRIDPQGSASVFADAVDGLFSPLAVAVDPQGNVFVADVLTNTIWKFDPQGHGAVFADATDGVVSPTDLAIDAGGNVYEVNYLANTIRKFDPLGNGVLFADASDGLDQPWGISLFSNNGLAEGGARFAAVPEPSAWVLAVLGCLALAVVRRRKTNHKGTKDTKVHKVGKRESGTRSRGEGEIEAG